MAPSRGLTVVLRRGNQSYIRRACRLHRRFTTTPYPSSGHNRWSKIKHDKLKTDAAKNRQRSVFAHEIAQASKSFGPDPNANGRLADLITKAKREGFAKASIEAAIARGQGRSLSGASLESVTVEGILPGNVGLIVDCETDNKARSLMDVRLILKSNGGTASPSGYLFTKKGQVVFERKDGADVEVALEAALEAGATDVEEDADGRLMVSCEPNNTKALGESVAKALDLQIATSEIIWEPNEDTKIGVPDEKTAEELIKVLDELQDDASVQGVSMNIAQGSLDGEMWKELQSRLGA